MSSALCGAAPGVVSVDVKAPCAGYLDVCCGKGGLVCQIEDSTSPEGPKGVAVSTVSRTFSVDASPEIVIAYLADFAHAEH
jgi:hypothetical protein